MLLVVSLGGIVVVPVCRSVLPNDGDDDSDECPEVYLQYSRINQVIEC